MRVSEGVMKALVVESSNTMRSVFRRLLCMRGFEVTEADNGTQALEVLYGMGAADIVLLNWSLYETKSLDFIAQLRQKNTHNTTVILLAAVEPGMPALHRALLAGADDYLIKPFTSRQIDEKLAKAGFTWQ
jgi:two-component system chemotaxis response regulator CheY